jgi:hypothetical protein
MSALKEKLGMGYVELLGEFKKRNIDFATVIAAILEYVEKYYSDAIDKTDGFWDVLLLKLQGRQELLEKEIMQSGVLQALSDFVDGLLKEFDKLAEDGTLDKWVKEIGENLTAFIRKMTDGEVSIKRIGEFIVDMTRALKDSAEPIKEFLGVLTNIASILGEMAALFSKLPANVQEAAVYGLITRFFLGSKAGAVAFAGSLGLDAYQENVTQENIEKILKEGMKGGLLDGFGGAGSIIGNLFKGGILDKSAEAAGNAASGSVTTFADQVEAYFNSQAGALKKFDAQAWEAAGKAVGTLSGTAGAAAPGETQAIGKLMELERMMKPFMDRFLQEQAWAGKTDFEKFQAQHEERRKELQVFIDEYYKTLDALQKILEPVGRGNEVEELRSRMSNFVSSVDAALNVTLTEEKKKYDARDAERWADVILSVEQYREKARSAQESIRDLMQDIEIGIKDTRGQYLEAELAQIENEKQNYINRLNTETNQLMLANEKILNKMKDLGKLDTPEGVAVEAELKKITDAYMEAVGKMVELANEAAAIDKEKVTRLFQLDKDINLANLAAQYSELTGSVREYYAVLAKTVRLEAERQAILAKSLEEAEMYRKIAEEQARRYEILASNDWRGAFKLGLSDAVRDIDMSVQQDWIELGAMMGSGLRDGLKYTFSGLVRGEFEDLGDFFNSLADSMIDKWSEILAEMLIEWMNFKTILNSSSSSGSGFWGAVSNFIGSLFGSGSSSTTAAENLGSGAGSIYSAVGNISGITSWEYHRGGIVGATSAPLRVIPPSLFANAPRLHSGLAADEFPAILQRGETVFPKGSFTGQNVSINLVNNTGVQATAKKGSGGPRWDGKQWVQDIILEAVSGGNESLMYAIASLKG